MGVGVTLLQAIEEVKFTANVGNTIAQVARSKHLCLMLFVSHVATLKFRQASRFAMFDLFFHAGAVHSWYHVDARALLRS